jgi:Flp pilus assembly protein TadB
VRRFSETLHERLQRIPLLRTALAEARRFETQGAVRAPVKLTALSFAWGSVLVVGATTEAEGPLLLSFVVMAVAAATLFMWWVPTEGK